MNPAGRAIIKPLHYTPPHEEPDEEYPLSYTTGRTVYHFHTRTKTARAPRLNEAAPEPWVEISQADAEKLGVGEGDLLRVESSRGSVEAKARISGVKEGLVFVPFHYGYFDEAGGCGPDGHPRAANELTVTEWDPVSKQPIFKVAAVRVTKLSGADGEPSAAPTTAAQIPQEDALVQKTADGRRAGVSETRR